MLNLSSLGLIFLACSCTATDSLSYPTPPNPFATSKTSLGASLPDPLLPEDSRLPHPAAALESTYDTRPSLQAIGKAKRHFLRPRWQPTVCIAALSAICIYNRPGEDSLLNAIDAYHQTAGSLIDGWWHDLNLL